MTTSLSSISIETLIEFALSNDLQSASELVRSVSNPADQFLLESVLVENYDASPSKSMAEFKKNYPNNTIVKSHEIRKRISDGNFTDIIPMISRSLEQEDVGKRRVLNEKDPVSLSSVSTNQPLSNYLVPLPNEYLAPIALLFLKLSDNQIDDLLNRLAHSEYPAIISFDSIFQLLLQRLRTNLSSYRQAVPFLKYLSLHQLKLISEQNPSIYDDDTFVIELLSRIDGSSSNYFADLRALVSTIPKRHNLVSVLAYYDENMNRRERLQSLSLLLENKHPKPYFLGSFLPVPSPADVDALCRDLLAEEVLQDTKGFLKWASHFFQAPLVNYVFARTLLLRVDHAQFSSFDVTYESLVALLNVPTSELQQLLSKEAICFHRVQPIQRDREDWRSKDIRLVVRGLNKPSFIIKYELYGVGGSSLGDVEKASKPLIDMDVSGIIPTEVGEISTLNRKIIEGIVDIPISLNIPSLMTPYVLAVFTYGESQVRALLPQTAPTLVTVPAVDGVKIIPIVQSSYTVHGEYYLDSLKCPWSLRVGSEVFVPKVNDAVNGTRYSFVTIPWALIHSPASVVVPRLPFAIGTSDTARASTQLEWKVFLENEVDVVAYPVSIDSNISKPRPSVNASAVFDEEANCVSLSLKPTINNAAASLTVLGETELIVDIQYSNGSPFRIRRVVSSFIERVHLPSVDEFDYYTSISVAVRPIVDNPKSAEESGRRKEDDGPRWDAFELELYSASANDNIYQILPTLSNKKLQFQLISSAGVPVPNTLVSVRALRVFDQGDGSLPLFPILTDENGKVSLWAKEEMDEKFIIGALVTFPVSSQSAQNSLTGTHPLQPHSPLTGTIRLMRPHEVASPATGRRINLITGSKKTAILPKFLLEPTFGVKPVLFRYSRTNSTLFQLPPLPTSIAEQITTNELQVGRYKLISFCVVQNKIVETEICVFDGDNCSFIGGYIINKETLQASFVTDPPIENPRVAFEGNGSNRFFSLDFHTTAKLRFAGTSTLSQYLTSHFDEMWSNSNFSNSRSFSLLSSDFHFSRSRTLGDEEKYIRSRRALVPSEFSHMSAVSINPPVIVSSPVAIKNVDVKELEVKRDESIQKSRIGQKEPLLGSGSGAARRKLGYFGPSSVSSSNVVYKCSVFRSLKKQAKVIAFEEDSSRLTSLSPSQSFRIPLPSDFSGIISYYVIVNDQIFFGSVALGDSSIEKVILPMSVLHEKFVPMKSILSTVPMTEVGRAPKVSSISALANALVSLSPGTSSDCLIIKEHILSLGGIFQSILRAESYLLENSSNMSPRLRVSEICKNFQIPAHSLSTVEFGLFSLLSAPTFFNEYVGPALQQKRAKSIIDHFLTFCYNGDVNSLEFLRECRIGRLLSSFSYLEQWCIGMVVGDPVYSHLRGELNSRISDSVRTLGYRKSFHFVHSGNRDPNFEDDGDAFTKSENIELHSNNISDGSTANFLERPEVQTAAFAANSVSRPRLLMKGRAMRGSEEALHSLPASAPMAMAMAAPMARAHVQHDGSAMLAPMDSTDPNYGSSEFEDPNNPNNTLGLAESAPFVSLPATKVLVESYYYLPKLSMEKVRALRIQLLQPSYSMSPCPTGDYRHEISNALRPHPFLLDLFDHFQPHLSTIHNLGSSKSMHQRIRDVVQQFPFTSYNAITMAASNGSQRNSGSQHIEETELGGYFLSLSLPLALCGSIEIRPIVSSERASQLCENLNSSIVLAVRIQRPADFNSSFEKGKDTSGEKNGGEERVFRPNCPLELSATVINLSPQPQRLRVFARLPNGAVPLASGVPYLSETETFRPFEPHTFTVPFFFPNDLDTSSASALLIKESSAALSPDNSLSGEEDIIVARTVSAAVTVSRKASHVSAATLSDARVWSSLEPIASILSSASLPPIRSSPSTQFDIQAKLDEIVLGSFSESVISLKRLLDEGPDWSALALFLDEAAAPERVNFHPLLNVLRRSPLLLLAVFLRLRSRAAFVPCIWGAVASMYFHSSRVVDLYRQSSFYSHSQREYRLSRASSSSSGTLVAGRSSPSFDGGTIGFTSVSMLDVQGVLSHLCVCDVLSTPQLIPELQYHLRVGFYSEFLRIPLEPFASITPTDRLPLPAHILSNFLRTPISGVQSFCELFELAPLIPSRAHAFSESLSPESHAPELEFSLRFALWSLIFQSTNFLGVAGPGRREERVRAIVGAVFFLLLSNRYSVAKRLLETASAYCSPHTLPDSTSGRLSRNERLSPSDDDDDERDKKGEQIYLSGILDYMNVYLGLLRGLPSDIAAAHVAVKSHTASPYTDPRVCSLFDDLRTYLNNCGSASPCTTGDMSEVSSSVNDNEGEVDGSLDASRLDISFSGSELLIRSVETVAHVRVWFIDLERAFSNAPFTFSTSSTNSDVGHLRNIAPHMEKEIILQEGASLKRGSLSVKTGKFAVDTTNRGIAGAAALVSVRAGGECRNHLLPPGNIVVKVDRSKGTLRVWKKALSSSVGEKSHEDYAGSFVPAAKAYVKVMCEESTGGVPYFLRDGYCDFAGRFPYAQVSTNGYDRAARIAILVVDESGSQVLSFSKL